MASKSAARSKSLMGKDALLALSGLSAFGITQPLLDLLGKNPQFLVVHNFDRLDLIILVLLLSIIPVIVLGLPAWLASLINESFGNRVLLAAATILLTIFAAPLINDLHLPGLIVIPLSIIPAFLLAWKLGGNPKLRPFWSLLGIIPLLVTGLFFSETTPRFILLSSDIPEVASYKDQPAPKSDVPVVMIVFDAFPTNSFMKENHEIDEILCPNLAALNEDAVWYKNALSISDDTLVAVPAILTGLYPQPDQQANKDWHPNNLFSWLRPWRPLHAVESHTRMSPLKVKPGSWTERWNLTTSDLWIIFLHSVLPSDFTGSLPNITNDWLNFAGNDSKSDKHSSTPSRVQLFDDFLASITTDEQGSCYFLHSLFPHTPFRFFPSGREYITKGKEPSGQGMQFGEWGDDIQAVVHSQQRLLNQVGYTDYLVGLAIDKLKKEGLYENAMIIFTADHGMSFSPGDCRRQLSSTNRGDILPVPLFIKYPGKGKGRTDERIVQTIDILPTIASVLKSPLPWKPDGHNLLDPTYKGHEQVSYLGAVSRKELLKFDSKEILAQRDAGILTKFQRFQPMDGHMALSAPFRGAELIGTQVPANLQQLDQWNISMAGAATFNCSGSPRDLVTAEVQGMITGETRLPAQWDIVILVDRNIAAFSRPFIKADYNGSETWSTLLPDELLLPGEHFLETVLVDWSQGEPEFFSPTKTEMSALEENLLLDTMFR